MFVYARRSNVHVQSHTSTYTLGTGYPLNELTIHLNFRYYECICWLVLHALVWYSRLICAFTKTNFRSWTFLNWFNSIRYSKVSDCFTSFPISLSQYHECWCVLYAYLLDDSIVFLLLIRCMRLYCISHALMLLQQRVPFLTNFHSLSTSVHDFMWEKMSRNIISWNT